MGATSQIILLGIVLLSSSWSVECASFLRHFRPVRDVEFPLIPNTTGSTVSIPTSTTLQQDNLKDLKTSNATGNDSTPQNVEHVNKIKQNESRIDEPKLSDLNKNETYLSKHERVSKEAKTVSQETLKSLNVDVSKDDNKGPSDEKDLLKVNTKVVSKDNLKEDTDLSKISQGSARSLNFDIDKYTSPDFHNKNNVYTLPTSPEIEKYIVHDTQDFASEVTKPTSQKKYFPSTPTKYNIELTTPPHTFFDSKFQNIAEGIKQYLEEFEATQSQNFEDNSEKYDVPTLIENTNNADNETKVSLEAKEFKNIQVSSDNLKGLKDEMEGSSIDYMSTYLKTRSYEDIPEKDTTVANTISDSESKDPEVSPSISEKKIINSTESSSKTTTIAPTKKSRQQSLRNNTIETAPDLKSKHFKLFTSTAPYDLDLIRETERMSTQSEGNNITKRGSTKYFEASTQSSDFHLDFDGKNFSIPPTATAWTLASFKQVPSTSGYKSKETPSTPEYKAQTEQNIQENQLVKVELLPTKPEDSTTEFASNISEISTISITPLDLDNLSGLSSNSPSELSTTEYTSTLEASITELNPLNLTSKSTIFLSNTKLINTSEFSNIEVPSSSEQSNTNAITKDDISSSSLQSSTASQSTPNYRTTTDTNIYSEINKTTTQDFKDTSSTENIINETTEITELNTATHTALNSESSTEFDSKLNTEINSEFSTETNYSTTEPDEKMMSDSTDIYEDTFSTAHTEVTTDSTTDSTSTDSVSWTTEHYSSSLIPLETTSDVIYEVTNIWNTSTDKDVIKVDAPKDNIDSSTTEEDSKKISSKTESENEIYTTLKTPIADTSKSPEIQNTTEVETVFKFIKVSTLEPIEEGTEDKKLESKANPVHNGTTTVTEPVKPTTEGDNSSDMTSSTEQLADDDDNDGGNNTGMIAAIAISAVGGICLVVLAGLLLIMRKRQKHVTYGQRCRPVSLDAYSLDNVSVYNSVRRKGALRASKRSYGNPAFDDPVSISHQMNFQILTKFADTPEEITTEFEEIPQVTARANEVPVGCETKNRYANVIPLPETRVFLVASDNDPHSDYINANFVTGPKNTRGYYIACQAPMQNTVDDFWRMIWEQQCRVVLMLTNLYENGVEKCVDYLPPSEVLDCHRLFGDFQVTLKKREVKEKYIISNLQLKNMVSNSWREVTHLWYLGWPERGVPSEANSLIAFLIEARSHLKAASNNNSSDKTSETININMSGVSGADGGPLVVHCSPGTGRTGTVIACDIAIRDFELTRAVDIPKIVYRVRRDRASAVQTREQYSFIYKLISLYATKLTGGALDSI